MLLLHCESQWASLAGGFQWEDGSNLSLLSQLAVETGSNASGRVEMQLAPGSVGGTEVASIQTDFVLQV